MADSLIQAELLAACSGLGYSDGIRYYKEADCLETVKDLIRYLRRDDDGHDIRRALGETKVLQTDLIPIVKFYSEDKELFDVTLRLLVNLTNPVLLLFKEELPEEKVTRQQYLQMVGHQQAFKEAFADEFVWKVLVGKLGEILNKEWEDREEDERLAVERILILVRNILVVAASPEEEKRTDDDASIHDQVLWALHLARFEDLILYIASSSNEQELSMHVIEVISLMLKEQDAAQLANAGLQRSQSEKHKDEKELLDMRKREALEKQQKIKRHYNARHSRFGGTYYVLNMKSISERDLIAHKHISNIESISFDNSKKSKKIPKNRLPLKDVDITRRSTLAIRLFLQEFCIEFLNGAFNSLMYIVKDNLNRAKAQEHDESYYLWAIKFFLEFNRNHNFRVELITETLHLQTFHYIQTLLESYFETMTTDKKKIPLWSRRMHKGLRAYQELLMTMSFMDKSENSDICESSKILKNKVFYVVEYRELVLVLLQNYDQLKMSRNYLMDLIETTHTFLKLMESICGKQKHLIVQKKQKPKRKSVKTSAKTSQKLLLTEEELVMKWDENSDHLFAIIKGESDEEIPFTIPYDPVSDIPEDVQKETSMKKINNLLRNKEFPEALSLLRSSRDIWPEGDIFGASNLDPAEELLCLRIIYMANINDQNLEPPPSVNIAETEELEEDSDEEQETRESMISEQEFDLVGFVRRFSHIKVMQAYALIFSDFFKNSDNTNHCILRMFHRLAWDCKIVAIFFQARIFRTFQIIIDKPLVISQCHKDAIKFIKFIFRKFIEVVKENDKVFVELLFWKTNKEALEIECGYGNDQSSKSTKQLWSEEEEDELRRLHEEFKDVTQEGKDVVDLITENLINENHTRRMVIRKLKEMNIILDLKEIRKTVTVRAPQQWSEEEIAELRRLVEEYIDAIQPLDRIMDHLLVKRPKKRVVEKIMELGLVENRNALRKKRAKKATSDKNQGQKFLQANASSEEGSGSDEDEKENEIIDTSDDEDIAEERSGTQNQNSAKLPPVVIATPAVIQASLSEVLEDGWKEAVEWTADLLKDTADEREADGDFEPIPLVSITEVCNNAMENDKFLALLKAVGIRPPRNHQEMFWRIPSNISVEGLRKRAQFLSQSAKGETNLEISFEDTPTQSQTTSRKKKKVEVEKLIKIMNESDDDTPSSTLGDEGLIPEEADSDSNILPDVVSSSSNPAKSTKRTLSSDSAENEKRDTKSKKRRIIEEEMDDDEEDSLRLHLDTEATQEKEEVDSAPKKMSRIYDSDDDDVGSPVTKPAKRRAVLMSDNEDDDDDKETLPTSKSRVIQDSDED